MSEMPIIAILAAIYPKFSAAFDTTLFSGLQCGHFIVIHDFIRGLATFGREVVHGY